MNKLDNTLRYDKPAWRGKLNLNCDYVIKSVRKCAELSLNDLVENTIGKFLYFYADNPIIENPITCCIGRHHAGIHPGQGRVIGAFFRKDPSIDSLFILLGKYPEEETKKIKEITLEHSKSDSLLFYYGKNVSTFGFKKYHDLNSNTTLNYMTAIRKSINTYLDHALFPIQWRFDYRDPITLYRREETILLKKDIKTVVYCDNAFGFYKSIAHMTNDNYPLDEFKIVKY